MDRWKDQQNHYPIVSIEDMQGPNQRTQDSTSPQYSFPSSCGEELQPQEVVEGRDRSSGASGVDQTRASLARVLELDLAHEEKLCVSWMVLGAALTKQLR